MFWGVELMASGGLNMRVLPGSGHGCLGLPRARPWPLGDLVPRLENEGVRIARRLSHQSLLTPDIFQLDGLPPT